MKNNCRMTAVIFFPRYGPDWVFTAETLAEITDLNYVCFVNKPFLHYRLFIFEVMGSPVAIDWLRGRLYAEDRKGKRVLYTDIRQ